MFKLRIVSGLVAVFLLLPAQAQTVGNADKPVELTVTNQGQGQVAGGPVSLDSLIQEAEQRNPGVQSALRQVQALRHRIPQARTLPDPTVSVVAVAIIKQLSIQKGERTN